MNYNTSEKGLGLIKKYEGLKLKSYKCPAGIWTIGYGSTGVDVVEGMEITKEEAEQRIKSYLTPLENKINKLNLYINQNQFDSIVSLCYNIGFGNFLISTLLKKVKVNPSDETIRNEFMKWNKANVKGVLKELPGLTKRRTEEANLYFDK